MTGRSRRISNQRPFEGEAVAVDDDLGPGNAEAVHAGADDLLRLVERLTGRRRAVRCACGQRQRAGVPGTMERQAFQRSSPRGKYIRELEVLPYEDFVFNNL